MRRRRPLLAVLIGLFLSDMARGEDILVVANPSVTLGHPLSTGDVAAIYLLRLTLWPDGNAIIPVNREISSDVRARFTAGVLHQDNASLIVYWNEMHFKGKAPPVVQESEQALLTFIRRVPGSVGYVSGGGGVPEGVVVLARLPVAAGSGGGGP
ncbi:hypothetical protein AZA_88314 [Nitrospirillum viridazoti Y2]|uniref:PBP domain-containing protein n=1 Tax=Nitrospirillum amazonense TaxID=28077 RepID=A0A560IGN2_9PROT|nr:hypothetical protein [Nitrospirillum amazonense]EGY01925.1 hypothetical protein AZA_88314 [Nitrospirillum amazonense Y2]TWB56234.1 hypothetical protein FBZ92_11223 [Nitrospirillum amazonense]